MLTRRPLLSRDAMVSKLARGWTAQGCARGDRINVRYSARLTVDGKPMRTELAANLKKAATLSLPLLYLSAAVEMFQRRPALAVTFCARCTARCPWR